EFAKLNYLDLTHPEAPARAMVVEDKVRPVDSPVFMRGHSLTKGDIVPRGFLSILSPNGKSAPSRMGAGGLNSRGQSAARRTRSRRVRSSTVSGCITSARDLSVRRTIWA